MQLRQLLSQCFLRLGCVFLLIAGLLLVQNANAERTATQNSAAALDALMTQSDGPSPDAAPTLGNFGTGSAVTDDNTISVNDAVYCGVLSLPSLSLTLPIQADFSYPNLKSSPCVYTQPENDALVIAAHNYAAHFGTLPQLSSEDVITYTTLDGTVSSYSVFEMRTIEETDLTAIKGNADELILFTCNIHDNTQRILVRCRLVPPEGENAA